ncbi:hypothetical protein ACOSQ3_009067 [Xanthoceras sorbifolium]
MLTSNSTLRFPAILLWCFSLLLPCTFSAPSPTITYTNETDHLSLLEIKSQLHDPLGVTSSWNNSVPLCMWTGVSCGHRHQRVVELDLKNQSIGGRLSPSIGNLSFLRSISLEDNNLYGGIPHEVGRLSRLKNLILSSNSFSGTMPTNLSFCSNLVTFYADDNNIVGEIPAEIGYLLKLEKLSIGENHLTGQIPASIGNLSALQVIYLDDNSLKGRIPDTLGQLRSLSYFDLGENKFTGTVPSSIYNISTLETFGLLVNNFHGSLPLEIGNSLPNLKVFIIAENSFTGPLPESLSNASNLVQLAVEENHFSGKVSIDFSGLKNLSYLHLGQNSLGTRTASDLDFVTSLTNCSKLGMLALYQNQFGGLLPQSIANLSTVLTGLLIGANHISGSIPLGIQNLVNLNNIGLEYNQLTGMIPHVIGEMKSLQMLYLNGNSLQGSIPSSLGNLTLLSKLRLESNNLQGNIPSTLGNCRILNDLSLFENKLTGTVPPQILSITTLSLALDLSDNLLSGGFPLEVGKLKNLIALNISGNRFSGKIPVTLGGCTSLEYLNLQGNHFSGSIPPSLSSLKSMKMLDLSSNNLSGRIPEYFENLSFMDFLNLSYNSFEGEVPRKGVFNNTRKFSLTGNKKLCGGLVVLHLPPCQSKRSNKSKTNLLKVLIPTMVSCLILSSAGIIVVITRRRKSSNKSSGMMHMEVQFPLVSYADLNKATNEFSSLNMIGQGSYGIVYKGILGEMLVAVKMINLQQKGASKSFLAECEALRNIRHRNLIKIITVCSSIDFKGIDFKALVYEYMENGSLEEWLHQNKDQTDSGDLNLMQRLNIAIDVASAIEYLHHHCEPPIVHGDLKPSNVLLDQDMVAHVGDFGLAKFLFDHPPSSTRETQSSTIGMKGTVGYVAPEYGMGSEVSMSGDVYSFGILLLEMFTERRPTDNLFKDGLTLHEFARMALPERAMEIIEPSLLFEVGDGSNNNNNVENSARHGRGRARIEECLVSILRTGVVCSIESPSERMEMTKVVSKLCSVREKFLRT